MGYQLGEAKAGDVMVGDVTLQTVGDWQQRIDLTLEDALKASMDIIGQTGKEACAQCIRFMTQSAAKMTIKAKKKRMVDANPDFKHVLR